MVYGSFSKLVCCGIGVSVSFSGALLLVWLVFWLIDWFACWIVYLFVWFVFRLFDLLVDGFVSWLSNFLIAFTIC
jgi:hypothetical protein